MKTIYIIVEISKDNTGTKKYLLSNNKSYTGKNLIKVNDIILYEPEEINNQEEQEFKETKKAIDLDESLKKVGMIDSNIVEGKRNRKRILKWKIIWLGSEKFICETPLSMYFCN